MTAVAILYIPKWKQYVSFKSAISVPIALTSQLKQILPLVKSQIIFSLKAHIGSSPFKGTQLVQNQGGEGTEEGGKKHFCTKPQVALHEKRIFMWLILVWDDKKTNYVLKHICFQ